MSPLHSDEREKNARGGVGSNVKPKHWFMDCWEHPLTTVKLPLFRPIC